MTLRGGTWEAGGCGRRDGFWRSGAGRGGRGLCRERGQRARLSVLGAKRAETVNDGLTGKEGGREEGRLGPQGHALPAAGPFGASAASGGSSEGRNVIFAAAGAFHRQRGLSRLLRRQAGLRWARETISRRKRRPQPGSRGRFVRIAGWCGAGHARSAGDGCIGLMHSARGRMGRSARCRRGSPHIFTELFTVIHRVMNKFVRSLQRFRKIRASRRCALEMYTGKCE